MGALKGSLQSIGLTDVVQLLHVNRKTGELRVSRDHDRGVLFVQEGEVVHAELGLLRGEGAAFEALEWDRGEFEFLPGKPRSAESIHRTVPDLLMEAARTSDSRRRLRSLFPSLDAVPWASLPEPQLSEGLKLFAEDRRVLPYFDGYRDFRQVMDATEQSEVTVLQAALTLREAGRLQVLDPTITLRATPLRTGLFKRGGRLELARAHQRAWGMLGPYARGTIAHLRVALPGDSAVAAVHFVDALEADRIAIPKEFMQAWGLSDSDSVSVRPAP